MPKRISGKYVALAERVYSRAEMESITGIPQSNKNFLRGVDTWLKTYGYSYEMTGRRNGDFRITGRDDSAKQQLHTIMIDEMGLDRQTQPQEFAYYIYFLMTYPNAEIMPLVGQMERISTVYGRSFSISTIQTWQNKLQAANVVDIDTSKNYWKTIRTDGKPRRVYIEDKQTDPDYDLYWKRLNEIMDENKEHTGYRCWQQSSNQMWNEMGMVIYSCPARLINIIGPHAKEVCELACEVVEADMKRLNRIFPSNVDWDVMD